MPNTTGTLFFNPSSGAKMPETEQQELKESATAAGLEVIPLTREVDITAAIRERMRMGRKLFVAAGGDGTITNVVQPLIQSDAVLGVIPVGTYNHFAKDVGIPLDWREALDVVVNGTTRQVDTARANDRFFVNNCSLGLYPELVARREAHGRDYPRWKARLFAFASTMRHYPHVTLAIEADGRHEVIRTHVFTVSNNSYDLSRLGIEAPRNRMTDGRLAVYWLPHLPRIALMKFCAHFLAGRVCDVPGFRSFRTLRLKVQSGRGAIRLGIDGELFTMNMPLTITIVPQSLLVKVPRD